MFKIIGYFLLLVLFNSCIYRDIKVPGPVTNITQYTLTTEDYKIIGNVEGEGEITTILGMVMTGGNGYSILHDKAKEMGADGIMNYVFELHETSILMFIYNKAKWKAHATAIKYTSKAKAK
ncbi:MAG: hypothetical protein H7A23_13595 [Leptospiraceae bacterium]|nr:hypothetical protein [Leptospiraceae bacterium]MCP5495585.1 hypothetical protein [Leptospiraceae bacterium]